MNTKNALSCILVAETIEKLRKIQELSFRQIHKFFTLLWIVPI